MICTLPKAGMYVCMYVCVGEELKSKANLVSIGQLPQITAFHYE